MDDAYWGDLGKVHRELAGLVYKGLRKAEKGPQMSDGELSTFANKMGLPCSEILAKTTESRFMRYWEKGFYSERIEL